jgi:hypothetical protein
VSRIDVGKDDLKKAWQRHEALGKRDLSNDSHMLLMIYAVECCLNHCLMSREKIYHTSRIAGDLSFGHAIDKLAKELGAPALCGYIAELPRKTYIAPGDFHSLFRYGGKLQPSDRNALLTKLEQILQWAMENQS